MVRENTFVVIKPDAVSAGVIGAILARFEAAGLRIARLELRQIDGAFADRHYAEHVAKDFYPNLKDFITSGPLVACELVGDDAVQKVRRICGATDPEQAAPGTLRADFGSGITRNAVHSSDSAATAARELALWFGEARN